MIIYRDPLCRKIPPPWIQDAPSLCTREDEEKGRLWGIGEAFLLGPAPDAAWHQLADGWQVRLAGALMVGPLVRPQRWCDVVPVESLAGVSWPAPALIDLDGSRIFRAAYGPDFLPALTPAQDRLLLIAREAQRLLKQGVVDGDMDATLGARYTAEALAATTFVAVDVFAALHLLDDALIWHTMRSMAGYRGEVASGHHRP